jgi:hypothetical protein
MMRANLTAKGLMGFKKRNLIAPFEKQALEVDKLIRIVSFAFSILRKKKK